MIKGCLQFVFPEQKSLILEHRSAVYREVNEQRSAENQRFMPGKTNCKQPVMPDIDLKPKAKKFIESLPPKHKRQVKNHILSLAENPIPHDSKKLLGYDDYLRTDIGEYRIIYRYESKSDIVIIVLIGKRNGDEIYRIAKRLC